MPDAFLELATRAAAKVGFFGFVADACLINRYEPGAKLSLHQGKDERNLEAPIVSMSLGISAILLFGGLRRAETPRRVPLAHGDVVVWGGPGRLRYHGVLPINLDPAVGTPKAPRTPSPDSGCPREHAHLTGKTVLQHQRAENFGALGVLGSSNAVLRIKDGQYPLLGGVRINLSFRKAAA
jgi:hypothetical protein